LKRAVVRSLEIIGEATKKIPADFKGASIIEANSFEEAVEIAKKSPTVKYGGVVEVFEEFQR
jgi:uncharacterized protein with HEPN domain